jgi:hypothetical protein
MQLALAVPFISQMVGGYGGNNCGPACLAMMLAHRGVIAPTQEAMVECADIARDGLSDDVGESGGYTTLAQLANVASWYGQETLYLGTWAAVLDQLHQGEPSVFLCDNAVLQPREYPQGRAFNAHHFVLLTGCDDPAGMYPCNDPLDVYAPVGPGAYTMASVEQGIALVGGVQALSLVPLPDYSPPPPAVQCIPVAELVAYFEQVGVPINPDTAIMQRAFLAHQRGETPGPAMTGEYPHGDHIRQDFTGRSAEWHADDNQVYWVELNLERHSV